MSSLPPDEVAPAACNLPWSLAVAGSGRRRHWPCTAQASTWPPLALAHGRGRLPPAAAMAPGRARTCCPHSRCYLRAEAYTRRAAAAGVVDGAIAGRGGGAVAIVGEDWIEVHLVQAKGQKGPFTTQIHEKEIREERKYT